MAITFDPVNKIIQLDSFSVSSNDIWTAFVDWSIVDDNIKYGEFIEQIGGYVPIALYIYIEDDWKIRPVESDGITTISGNVLVSDGTSPITSTLGSWQILVNMETPVKAISISVDSGSGLTTAESDALLSIGDNLDIINDGVKKSSLQIPHVESLT